MAEEYLYRKGYIEWDHKAYRDEDGNDGFMYDLDALDENEIEWLQYHNDMDWRE